MTSLPQSDEYVIIHTKNIIVPDMVLVPRKKKTFLNMTLTRSQKKLTSSETLSFFTSYYNVSLRVKLFWCLVR